MNEHLELLLISATPMLIVVAFLLLGLLYLRALARRKSTRMSRAEHSHTGIGTTTWDAFQGSATLGPATDDQNHQAARR